MPASSAFAVPVRLTRRGAGPKRRAEAPQHRGMSDGSHGRVARVGRSGREAIRSRKRRAARTTTRGRPACRRRNKETRRDQSAAGPKSMSSPPTLGGMHVDLRAARVRGRVTGSRRVGRLAARWDEAARASAATARQDPPSGPASTHERPAQTKTRCGQSAAGSVLRRRNARPWLRTPRRLPRAPATRRRHRPRPRRGTDSGPGRPRRHRWLRAPRPARR